ncbi:TPA: hypothetical protein KOR75_001237 [Clostridioides difficile]|nr:hypothetical protein [Clostridioides difficile]
MFYFDETKAKYPRKGILEDAVKRNSIDENSYSPIIDEIWNELHKYEDHEAFYLFPYDGFPYACTEHKDFSLQKLEEVYQRSVSSENDEPTRYEMINLDHQSVIDSIVRYAANIIYGWFYIDNKGARAKGNVYKTESYVRMKDNSDSDIMVSASDYMEDIDEDTIEDKDKIYHVSRLTYYLKLIQECSIAKGVSIMQLMIAEARCGLNASLIVKEGIAKIGIDGNIIDIYGPNHNTSKAWNDVWRWYTSPERDMWGRIVDEFKNICKQLKIDLRAENYKDFTPKVVNNLLSVYLASNEEYIDTIGRCDKTVFGMLDPERLLNVRSNIPGFNQDWMYQTNEFKFIQAYIAKIERVQLRAEIEEWKWDRGHEDLEFTIFLQNKESVVEEFFSIFISVLNMNTTIKEFMSNYYYNDYNILCAKSDGDELPVSISRATLCNYLGFRDAPEKICFTINGLAISKVSGQDDAFRYCEVSKLIDLMRTGVNYAYPSGQIECI